MIFPAKELVLKDGRTCVLRAVEESDAESLITHLRVTAEETLFLIRAPEEAEIPVEEEREFLRGRVDAKREFLMLAVVGNTLAGTCGIVEKSERKRIYHRSGIGIALKKEFWGLGIGRAMMEYAFALAKDLGYEQVELEVVEGNTRAKRLYESLGFVTTGKNLRAMKYDDGSTRDEELMVKFL